METEAEFLHDFYEKQQNGDQLSGVLNLSQLLCTATVLMSERRASGKTVQAGSDAHGLSGFESRRTRGRDGGGTRGEHGPQGRAVHC